ncbi:hypothetical protein GALMADRAFT_153539, partial [Galerina marginata CBS 339.88]
MAPKMLVSFRSREARTVGVVEEDDDDDDDADDNGSRTDVRCSGGASSIWIWFRRALFAANLLASPSSLFSSTSSPYLQRLTAPATPGSSYPPSLHAQSCLFDSYPRIPHIRTPLIFNLKCKVQIKLQRNGSSTLKTTAGLRYLQNDLQCCGYFSPGRLAEHY